MASAQLKTWMCNLGIAFRVQNNNWERGCEWSQESSRSKKLWIPHVCSGEGRASQRTKQASVQDCLPSRGAAESSAYGVGRFRNALEISFRMIILIPEIWEPDDDAPGRSARREMHFSDLSPELFTKFGPQRLFIISKTQVSSTNISASSL